jgi:hypothetical protein
MLAPVLLTALAATLQAPAPPPAVEVRAQTQVFVQIIQAAEVRNGSTSSPHQRTVRLDEGGQKQILLQFE